MQKTQEFLGAEEDSLHVQGRSGKSRQRKERRAATNVVFHGHTHNVQTQKCVSVERLRCGVSVYSMMETKRFYVTGAIIMWHTMNVQFIE